MINFILIDDSEQLQQAAKEWKLCKELAIDLECENNLHHYGVFISIIQLSSRDKNWIVDVIKVKEINRLKEILENPNITKVFHDISFDFRILNKQFQVKPKNVFDTQMAALLLGRTKFGLSNLLEEYFKIKKEEKFQKVDWTRRPLSLDMLSYAVKDSAYLLQLKDKLTEELNAKQRTSWMKDESEYLEEMDFIYHEQTYINVSRAKKLQSKELALFHVLFEEREKMARRLDRPNYMIVHNEVLMELSKNPPKNSLQLRSMCGVHPIVKNEAEKIFRLIQDALKKPGEAYDLKPPKLNQQQFEWKEKLLELRKKTASKLGISGHLLLNEEQIINIATSKSLSSLKNWQKELLEKEIKKELKWS